jgi:AsmA protein
MTALRRLPVLLIEVCVACAIASAVCLFLLARYVDTPDFRERFTTVASGLLGRPVELKGELNIVLYPTLSLEISNFSILDSQEFLAGSLAEMDRLLVSVKLLPLMAGDVEIRSVVVYGLRTSIIRAEDGTVNWMRFLQATGQSAGLSSGGGDLPFQINSVSLDELEVSDASIAYSDRITGLELALSGLELRSGGIARNRSIPFVVRSVFAWDHGGVNAEITLKGMVAPNEDWSAFLLDEASVYASVGGAFLPAGASPGEMAATLAVDWAKKTVSLDDLRVHFLGLRAEGNLVSGDLSRGVGASGHVALKPFTPSEILTRYYPAAPVSSVNGLDSGAFSAFFDIDESGVSFHDLVASLDDMIVRGRLDMKGFASPCWNFELRGDTIDLDRYMPLLRTDAPFVWKDFHLDTLQKFCGKGMVAASGLTVDGTVFSSLRLGFSAEAGALRLEAQGATQDGLALETKASLSLGRDAPTGAPTLAGMGELTARSGSKGVEFSRVSQLRLQAGGAVKINVETTAVPCPPEGRSMEILRFLKGTIDLALDKGRVSFDKGTTDEIEQAFSAVKGQAEFSSVKGGGVDQYGMRIATSVSGQGQGKGETFSLSAKGPLAFGVDSPFMSGTGMTVAGQVAGPLFFGHRDAVSASGTLAFDTRIHRVALTKGVIGVLETALSGDVEIMNPGKAFTAKGRLSISKADPSRIIFLLSGKTLSTKDPAALKSASFVTDFTMNPEGFTLDRVEAALDGMSIRGNVVGTGLVDPMLSFAFTAGALDIDRYLPSSPTPEEIRQTGPRPKAPPVDLPLTFLRSLRLNGKGAFDEFKIGLVRARPFSARVSADKGIIQVHDAKGTVHGGDLEGMMSGQVSRDSLATQLQLEIREMQAGELMVDMAGRDYVRGVTNVDLDLGSSGRTDDDIVAHLAGAAKVEIRDGSFKFSEEAATPQKGRDTMGRVVDTPKNRRTVFKRASNVFAVEKGVFTIKTMRVEAPPVLQCYGSGWFNLPNNTIDMSIRNDFVVVPSVTFRIVGKLSDPEVKVPKEKILNDTVRNILSLPEKSFNFLRDLFR